MRSDTNGFIPFREYKTWYRIIGDIEDVAPGKHPILALHGSPISHQSILPLAQLADTGRPVIFYDQLGCGFSDQPEDPTIWGMDLFVEQLATVRDALDLNHIHLFGHSFGGMIALDYLLAMPNGITSLILHSTPVSQPLLDAEWGRLRSELPQDVQETLAVHEANGTTDDPAYLKAQAIFDHQHICRPDPWPDYLLQSLENLQVAEFDNDDWDFRGHLEEIAVPTLITSGTYDIVTPMMAKILHDGIDGSEWILFEESSHYPHAEETEFFLDVMNNFLTKVEQSR